MEHGTFTPLVLSSSGGWGPSAMVAYKRLASLTAEKHGHPYSSTISWIRCIIAFSLIASAMACLRALRSSYHALPRRLIRSINCWTSFTLRSSRLNILSYQLLHADCFCHPHLHCILSLLIYSFFAAAPILFSN